MIGLPRPRSDLTYPWQAKPLILDSFCSVPVDHWRDNCGEAGMSVAIVPELAGWDGATNTSTLQVLSN